MWWTVAKWRVPDRQRWRVAGYLAGTLRDREGRDVTGDVIARVDCRDAAERHIHVVGEAPLLEDPDHTHLPRVGGPGFPKVGADGWVCLSVKSSAEPVVDPDRSVARVGVRCWYPGTPDGPTGVRCVLTLDGADDVNGEPAADPTARERVRRSVRDARGRPDMREAIPPDDLPDPGEPSPSVRETLRIDAELEAGRDE